MKRATWILAVAMIVLPGAAVAQMASNAGLVTDVPFEFMVGNHIVQGGEWTVKPATMDGQILAISNSAAKLSFYSTFLRDESREAAASYALVFKQYGDRYFLSGIRIEGSKVTYRLPMSNAEAELRAKNAPAAEKILLASVK